MSGLIRNNRDRALQAHQLTWTAPKSLAAKTLLVQELLYQPKKSIVSAPSIENLLRLKWLLFLPLAGDVHVNNFSSVVLHFIYFDVYRG